MLDDALVHFAGDHTNVVLIEKDGEILHRKKYYADGDFEKPNREQLSIERIIEYADEVAIGEIEPILSRQIEYNTKKL